MTGIPPGKTALVTGGTDGVGKEIARALAAQGIRVVIVGRQAAKGASAERQLREETGNREVWFLPADLSLMTEAARLADTFAERWPALHFLVLNAGIVRGRRVLTAEGVESNFAVNYLSRFALTRRLLPLLRTAGVPGEAARILVVSGAAQIGRIDYANVNLEANFSTLRAVVQVCHANDVFTVELSRRLRTLDASPPVTVTCLKLGVIKTGIRNEFPLWMRLLVPLLFDPLLGQTPREAAGAGLRLLLGPEFEGVTGALFSKIRRFRQVAPTALALDQEEGRRLWALSDRLAGD